MPRLYYLHPWLAGPLAGWGPLLDRVAAMGFDRVLVAPPWAAGTDVLVSADLDALDPRLGTEGDWRDGIVALAEACRERGLTPGLDLVPDRAAADGGFVARNPDWFTTDTGPFGDPRRPPPDRGTARLRGDDPAVAAAATEWWTARVSALAEAGIAGFRCEGAARLPASFWRAVTEAGRRVRPDAQFFAWTPGIAWPELGRLEGCGFDWVFASTPWWDFRSPWLLEEHARLSPIAPQIAAPEAPFGPRVGAGLPPSEREAAMRRALWLATLYGDGLMVPMGFEHGSAAPLGRAEPADVAPSRAGLDLSGEIARANAYLAGDGGRMAGGPIRQLTAPTAAATVLLRRGAAESAGARLLLVNPDLGAPARVAPETFLPAIDSGASGFRPCGAAEAPALTPGRPVDLAPAEVKSFTAQPAPPILLPVPKGLRGVEAGMKIPRLAIERVAPVVEGGTFPVKRTVGEIVHVEADVIGDGHDQFAAAVLYRAADETAFRESRMRLLGNDRWTADFPLERLGRHVFVVEAWCDLFATFRSEIVKKRAAAVPIALELEEGRRLVESWARSERGIAAGLPELLARLDTASDDERYALFTAPETEAAMQAADPRPFANRSPEQPVDAERLAARFSSWYEMFPRSASGDPSRHGTFDDVVGRLPYVRDLGFDTLYFPPIHPIGRKNRKGRNNTLTPGPDDPGSPYAIGADEGGHDAIHPELGTLEDFRRLIAAAKEHGLEIALDFAIQCSPDHPWLREHPDWFNWRPDGTIRYAENPPKKYEDIVNVDFYAPGAMPGLWVALRDVVLFWVNEGVKVFRVDNPHTKPLPFWQWMIGEVRARHPEVIFLSEAFTRPKVMYRLAKVGYSQSYTYFTWRNEKWELREYLEELSTTNAKEFFRPHFFVNTPDINPDFLQNAPRPAYLIRAALATTLSGLWGMYNGFELCEGRPDRTKKEYADSEKYEIRAWDWDRPGNIRAEIARLNAIRKANPALQSHLGVEFLNAYNDRILYFEKATPARDNVVLVAVNLDPYAVQEATIEVPLWKFGLPDHARLAVEDLMSGAAYRFDGKHQTIRLDPNVNPFAILRVTPAS